MYKLSKRSLNELAGVHQDLRKIVEQAIQITTQDFIVLEGLRTIQEQQKNVARGVSKTMKSYHLYGLAVDLVPVVNGKIVFEIKLANGEIDQKATLAMYQKINKAMKIAIAEEGAVVDWGYKLWGWDMPHYQITKLKGVDARLVYDYRKGGYYA